MKTRTTGDMESCGNVYADLGLKDAGELQAKTDLVIKIHKVMKQRKLTQVEAAAICGADQPTLSKLLNGKFESITIDKLAQWLIRLGADVEIKVKEKKRYTGKAGSLRVAA